MINKYITLPAKFVVDSSAYIPIANGRGKDYLKTNTKNCLLYTSDAADE